MTGLSKTEFTFAENFKTMATRIHEWAKEKGFWEGFTHSVSDGVYKVAPDNPLVIPTKLALIHSEVTEALEADRNSAMDDKLPFKSGLEVELADAVIRIMDLATFMNFDLGLTIIEKMEFNQGRPFKHGKEY